MIKNNVTYIALLLFLSLGFTACLTSGDPMEDWVVVPVESVEETVSLVPGPTQEGATLDLEVLEDRNQLPDFILEQVQKAQLPTTVAIVQRKHLKATADPNKVINLSFGVTFTNEQGEQELDPVGTAQTIAGTIAGIFPASAPYVALGSLLIGAVAKKRSRKLLVRSVKKAVPADGTIDIAGAIKDFSRAIGWDHTSDSPDDLRRRADLLEAELEAKAKSKEAQKELTV